MLKWILISVLLLFGISYSIILALYTDLFVGFVFVLITIGFAATIYLLDKKFSHRIIFYVWVAIITTAVLILILVKSFQMLS
jgi:hypothetical protein